MKNTVVMVVVMLLVVATAAGSIRYCIEFAKDQESEVFAKTTDVTLGWQELGTRGDFWGGFAGIGVGVASTILFAAALFFQSRELSLQRQELKDSRVVAMQQATALEKQYAALQFQNQVSQLRNDADLIMSLAERAAREFQEGADDVRGVFYHHALVVTFMAAEREGHGLTSTRLMNLFASFVPCPAPVQHREGLKKWIDSLVEGDERACIRDWAQMAYKAICGTTAGTYMVDNASDHGC